jgi:hypothetical protein
MPRPSPSQLPLFETAPALVEPVIVQNKAEGGAPLSVVALARQGAT